MDGRIAGRWWLMARLVAGVVCGLAVAGSAVAQTAGTPPEAPPPAGTTPAFVVQSDNGDNRLQLGMIAQFDGRFVDEASQHGTVDSFLLRRFRTVTQGQVARHFPFFLNVDLAGGVVNLRDAWVETRMAPALRIRVGKFQAPFSYDRLILIANILFVERGLTTTVAPDREVGVQVLGDVARGRLSYAAALTNGAVDGGATDVDTNDGKDVTFRLVGRPWAARPERDRLRGLGVAFATSTGMQGTQVPSFPLPGRQTYFSYGAGASGDGRRTRWSPQAFYYRGPFGAYGEFVHSEGGIRRAAVRENVAHEAWQVAASWVLTGEAAGERNVRPRVNFDPPSRHIGAFQIAGRVQGVSISPVAIATGLAAPGASRGLSTYTVGLNWYLNPFVKWNLDLERTTFDRTPAGLRPAETALLLRSQLVF